MRLITTARSVLKGELHDRCFTLRSSNARTILLYMSKQQDMEGMFNDSQFELARTLYLQALRSASEIVKLKTRTSPRARSRSSRAAARSSSAARLCFRTTTRTRRLLRRERLRAMRWPRRSSAGTSSPPSRYHDEDGLLNEFEMMWALRDRFPLHLVVFKQMASHLAHEANVEQVFSRAGSTTSWAFERYLRNPVTKNEQST